MPASSEASDAALFGQEACVNVQRATCGPVATGSHAPADPKLGVESGKKRKLQSGGQCVQTMQRDCLGMVKAVQGTPDRVSSEEGSRGAVHVGAGLPPKIPVKLTAKAVLMSEGITAAQEENTRPGKTTKAPDELTKGQQRLDTAKPSIKTRKASNLKAKRPAAPKKVAAKSEHMDRRRKRKADDENEATGISQSSASLLFQCSCQLLRSQALDYDVRARERVERNAEQVKEVGDWERKIRALRRELQEYADEDSDAGPDESAGMALIQANPGGGNVAATAAENGATGEAASVEGSLPPGVLAAEAKLQEELRRRTQEVNEFCRSVPGFLESLDEHTTHHF